MNIVYRVEGLHLALGDTHRAAEEHAAVGAAPASKAIKSRLALEPFPSGAGANSTFPGMTGLNVQPQFDSLRRVRG